MTIESIKKGEFYWIERGVIICSKIASRNGYDEISDVTQIVLPPRKKNGAKYPDKMIQSCLDKGYVVCLEEDVYKLTNDGYKAYRYYMSKPDKNEVDVKLKSKVISLHRAKQAKNEQLYSCPRCDGRLILPVLMGGIVAPNGDVKHCTKRKICAHCYMKGVITTVD